MAGRLNPSVDPSVADGIDETFLAVPREVPSNVAPRVHATRTSILVHVNGHVVLGSPTAAQALATSRLRAGHATCASAPRPSVAP